MKPYAALLASALVAALPLAAQTPVDPKSPIPGYPDGRGPKGPVTIKFVSPAADVSPPPMSRSGTASWRERSAAADGAGSICTGHRNSWKSRSIQRASGGPSPAGAPV